MTMNRVVVIGTTGAGQSTLAERLARRLDGDFVDLDALHWGPNWAVPRIDDFRQRVEAALAGERWAVAGNYSITRDIVWGRADTLIWLDYPLPLILWRLLRRTVRRVFTREELWNGNREHLREQFASRESLFYIAVTTYRSRRRKFAAALAQPEYAHLVVWRFRRPGELARWERALQAASSARDVVKSTHEWE